MVALNHDAILDNRAQLQKTDAVPDRPEGSEETLVFALQDRHHAFSLDLETVLQCLRFAEAEGAIPELPTAWWKKVTNRYKIRP
jgi:hypothetical protein